MKTNPLFQNGIGYPINISQIKLTIKEELMALLAWWQKEMIDINNGGFYGRIDGQNVLHPKADKGVILNTRILWAFAQASRFLSNSTYKRTCHRAYQYILNYFWDNRQGGVYWMLDYQGNPIQTKKQIYAQAFAIYALSEYYLLTKDQKSLDKALELFWLIEKYSRDNKQGGYFEAFDEAWQPLEDLRLSDKDANEAKTMNTHLHILEAYTNLYRAYPNDAIRQALIELIHLFLDKFIDPKTYHLHLFFDEDWQLKSHEVSFGHDIECSWLLWEALEVIDETALFPAVREVVIQMAQRILLVGIDTDGGIPYEFEPIQKKMDKHRHWWPQAEAMVGFLNAYQLSGDITFLKALSQSWNFINTYLKDKKKGEWYWMVDEKGIPSTNEDKAGPWKAPYHNVRACMEVLNRINEKSIT